MLLYQAIGRIYKKVNVNTEAIMANLIKCPTCGKQISSNKQISEAIKANLKGFLYTYENREDEKESSEKILTAIKNLQPETKMEATER